MTIPSVRTIPVESLDESAFAPFGELVANDGGERRRFHPAATLAGEGAGELRFWASHVEPAPVPLEVARLECHPWSVQTFVPLSVERWIVIVAPTGSDGLPVEDGLRAFLAGPGMGISYRRGTWHNGTTVLGAAASFAVLMWRRNAGDDDRFHDLRQPVRIRAAASSTT